MNRSFPGISRIEQIHVGIFVPLWRCSTSPRNWLPLCTEPRSGRSEKAQGVNPGLGVGKHDQPCKGGAEPLRHPYRVCVQGVLDPRAHALGFLCSTPSGSLRKPKNSRGVGYKATPTGSLPATSCRRSSLRRSDHPCRDTSRPPDRRTPAASAGWCESPACRR